MRMLQNLWQDDRGQDLVEYALVAAFAVAAGPAVWGTRYTSSIGLIMTRVKEVLDNSIT